MNAIPRVPTGTAFADTSVAATVLIWYVPFATLTDAALLEAYRALITAQERAQETRFYFERDRRRYLVTRALVRTVLGRCVDVDPAKLTFTTNAYGRPELHACRGISFNVSHTNDLVVLGVTHGRALGLDAENAGDRPAPLDIADRFFSRREVHDLRALPAADRRERFFDYWTLKESYIKARGMGLAIPLSKFSFRLADDRSIDLDIEPELGDSPQHWMFYQYRLLTDYILSLCVETAQRSRVAVAINESIPLVAERRAACMPFRWSLEGSCTSQWR